MKTKASYEGSQLQEMLNQLIERLVEEGYLKLHEEPLTAQQRREMMGGKRRRTNRRAPAAQR